MWLWSYSLVEIARGDLASVFMVAVAWNSLNLFVTHLFQAGAGQFWSLLHTGRVSRPDTLMVMVGGLGHFVLIVACMAGFLEQRPGVKHSSLAEAYRL